MSPEKLTKLEKLLTLALAVISIVLILIAFRAWLFNFSILTNGDWSFFFNETATTLRINYFSIWLSDNSFGRVLIDVGQAPTYSLYGVLSKYLNFSYAINERLVHFWPALIISFTGSFLFFRKLFISNAAILVGIISFCLNTYLLKL
jgi:hypothetical protein